MTSVDDIRTSLEGIEAKLMHVCGTHEQEITRHGIRSLLPRNIEIVSGPGCPVCITPKADIDKMIFLAEHGITITTYGDMLRVPSSKKSLQDAKANGADVRIVYSITNALEIARREKDKEIVHFAIGFETTAPTTCVVLEGLPETFSVYSVHRLIPPTLDFLLSLGESNINGFIDPGHVSVIIGSDAYRPISEKFRIPQVITGFTAEDILRGIAMLINQIREGRHEVENQYFRVVHPEGNLIARKMMEDAFEVVDAEWRALGYIPRSGYELKEKYAYADAKRKYEDVLEKFVYEEKGEHGCRCGEVLRGLINSKECPLFAKVCSPESPVGPCMVGNEGTCSITYNYGRFH